MCVMCVVLHVIEDGVCDESMCMHVMCICVHACDVYVYVCHIFVHVCDVCSVYVHGGGKWRIMCDVSVEGSDHSYVESAESQHLVSLLCARCS